MLSWIALTMALIVQGACMVFALSLDSEMSQRLQLLRQGIERDTRRDEDHSDFPLRVATAELSDDASLIEACLDDIFSSHERRAVVHSLNELSSLAKLGLERTQIALKSLSHLGLLSGAAAAVFILAVEAFESAAWTLAGAASFSGIISSLVSVFVTKRAHRRARSLAELVQKLRPATEKGSQTGGPQGNM